LHKFDRTLLGSDENIAASFLFQENRLPAMSETTVIVISPQRTSHAHNYFATATK